MPYEFYKLMHFFGIFMMLGALGGNVVHYGNGGDKEAHGMRRLVAMAHGIGLLLVLVGGFGMTAKLGLGFPGWVGVKLLLWLVLGAALALPMRMANTAKVQLFVFPAIALLAAYLAIYKPF
jgi:hypothetical protein